MIERDNAVVKIRDIGDINLTPEQKQTSLLNHYMVCIDLMDDY